VAVSLTDLLLDSARFHPERPAVAAPGEGRVLTYAELALRSARLGQALLDCGVGRGSRVALVIPKGIEAVVAMWGALRVGAAYVPVDTSAPPQRAAFIVKNCAASAVVASSEMEDRIEAIRNALPDVAVLQVHGSTAIAGARRVDLDRDDTATTALRTLPEANVRDLAYILYTSGSTGEPKGVMLSHGAALSFVDWCLSRFGLVPEDVVSNHAPLHFDLSTFDFFGAASASAKVVVLDEEAARFPMESAGILEHEGITVWYSVPGALRRMLRLGRLGERDLHSLKTVLFAGESYPAEELRALQSALPHVALFNLYGPTETCTYWQVPPAGSWSDSSIPIGIDCSNSQSVVVDQGLQPVPDGTAGELLVRGGNLMEGYWGDPERTRRSLVIDFLHPHLSDFLYRTGDIVSRREDGNYVFHGRADHMVKVRGYRVELGDVESAVRTADGIDDVAVVAVERESTRGGGAEKELVAFVVSSEGEQPEREARLMSHVEQLLPKHMLPSEVHWVKQLPTTSTGKLDRRALESLASQKSEKG
jgi:amino acid adenylation domain-containing protein